MYRKIFFVVVFLCGAFDFAGCSCNCGKTADEENTVRGYITVVGNEPFTNLAIRTDEGRNIILKCSKELEKELLQHQGSRYLIRYSEISDELGSRTLIVEKVIPILETK